MLSETRLLVLFVVLTPIVVWAIRLGLRKGQIVVLANLSALLLTGLVTLLFAAIAASYGLSRGQTFFSWPGAIGTAIDFCLIFTPAHWIYQVVKNWQEKRAKKS
jgi:hypothetical protein